VEINKIIVAEKTSIAMSTSDIDITKKKTKTHQKRLVEDADEENSNPHKKQRLEVTEEVTMDDELEKLKRKIKYIKFIEKLKVDPIMKDETPKPKLVVAFLKDMDQYRESDPLFIREYLKSSIKGERGKQWCLATGYNYNQFRQKLIEWVTRSEEWAKLKVKFEQKEALGENTDTHILTFKYVVYLEEMNLEDERTKQYFVQSLPPTFLPSVLMNDDGKYKSFTELESFALQGSKGFDEYFARKKPLSIAAISDKVFNYPSLSDKEHTHFVTSESFRGDQGDTHRRRRRKFCR